MTRRLLLSSAAAVLILALAAPAARAQFVEPDATALTLFEGREIGDYYGWVAAALGDLDGDGTADFAIPAIAEAGFAGRVTVYSGVTGAVLNDIAGGPGQVLGYSVADAGDVDADGVADYIVGGGRVAVFSGADHTVLHELAATTGFGSGVTGAGDLDGDGHDDLLVGAQGDDTAGVDAGRAFAISGADGAILWTRDGAAAGDFLGSAAGVVGDLGWDGVPEVVVGATGAARAYVLDGATGELVFELAPGDDSLAVAYGQFFASGAGDVDRDWFPDVFVADYAWDSGRGKAFVYSGRTGALIRSYTGVDAGDGLGPGRGVGDLNGDGWGDVLVAGYTDDDGGAGAGRAYLYSGRSGALLRTVTATLEGDNFGVDALTVGDVDGDGLPELLVTAVGLAFAGTDVGRAYLIAGTVLPCPADRDGDGWVTFLDLFAVYLAVATGDTAGDLNGDRLLDHADLRVVVRDLGRCPAGRPRY